MGLRTTREIFLRPEDRAWEVRSGFTEGMPLGWALSDK